MLPVLATFCQMECPEATGLSALLRSALHLDVIEEDLAGWVVAVAAQLGVQVGFGEGELVLGALEELRAVLKGRESDGVDQKLEPLSPDLPADALLLGPALVVEPGVSAACFSPQ